MATLKQIIEDGETPVGQAFDISIQCLIVLSLVTFSIETLPNLSETTRHVLSIIELATVAIFSVEYLLRLWVARPRSSYAFSFFGVIDLIAIAPFYLGLAVDLRSWRVFRLLRLLRLFKLARYNAAVRRFHLALDIAKEELVLFVIVTIILLYVASVGIYHFESNAQPEKFGSVFHSLWWSVATLTTVGYGDTYPVTVGGRIFTFFILLIGLGVISVPAGLVASALAKARQIQIEENQRALEDANSTAETENPLSG